MIDHDKNVGEMLDLLDELGIADNTFVMYSSDNGPHMNTWPDGAMTPFRSEKNTNWEGAFRVPLLVRWPGKIEAGSVCNEIVQHHDWLPTFLAMAGDTGAVDKLKKGATVNGKKFKNHIDGYNLLPYLTGEGEGKSAQDSSSTSATTATCWASATTTGSSCSWSSAAMEPCSSGRSRSRACACRRYSTCAWIPTSAPTSRRTRTTTGCCTTRTSSTRRRWRQRKFVETFKEFPRGAEARQLHHRRGDVEDERSRERELATCFSTVLFRHPRGCGDDENQGCQGGR